MKCQVVTTRSGAKAVRDLDTGELMHPVVGPLVEAQRLYVEPSRLAQRLTQPITLFDVGLGAGSNAAAAFRVALRLRAQLRIISFDRSLQALEIALEHAADFDLDGEVGVAARALLQRGRYDGDISWRYVDGELPTTLDCGERADIVYWDPFSPKANPRLWGCAAFAQLHRQCNARCTVHTYSGATSVRSALLLADFAVGVGPAINDEKQSTIAAVAREDLAAPLDRHWLERVARSSAPFPADAPSDALEKLATKL